MEVRLQALALRDLEAGVRFYDKGEAELGRYFAETLLKEIMSLADTGGMHPKSHGSFHRFVSAKFPYVVYYKVDKEVVRVFAVFACRRNPEQLRRRLGM